MKTLLFKPRAADTPRQKPDPAAPAPPSTNSPYIARQPILSGRSAVFGYELNFRSPAEGANAGQFGGALALADAVLTIGLDTLTRGRPAFLRMTRAALVEGIPTLLPPDQIVVQVGDDVAGDADAINACVTLVDAGYKLALDHFDEGERPADLVKIADFIKVDLLAQSAPERAETLRSLATAKAQLIAVKIATVEQFEQAQWEGFTYFQGYFFGQAVMHRAREIGPRQVACLQLLKALNDPNLSLSGLEEIIKHDAMLTYRLLRAVRSAGAALPASAPAVKSIQLALTMLGRDTVRRWASLWTMGALADQGQNAAAELVTMSTVRARCCELLDTRRDGDGFLLGMCSLLDVILGQPLEEIVGLLPLADETREALCGTLNAPRMLLDCVIAYERANWDECERLAKALRLDPDTLPRAYRESLEWTLGLEGSAA